MIKPKNKQLFALIDAQVLEKFKRKCDRERRCYSKEVENIIKKYLEEK